jgi:hypothetical protein
MKRTFFITSLAVGLLSFSAHAASFTYVSDFSGLGVDVPLDGIDGWQQSEPNFSEEFPRAFGAQISIGGTFRPAAAIGGYYDPFPAEDGRFYIYHTLSLSQGMSFSMNFALLDSVGYTDPDDANSPIYGLERNPFEIGFYNGNTEVFSLVFDPNPGPDSEENPDDTWNVSISSRGVKSLQPSMAIFETQLYALNLSLTPNDSDLNYWFSLTSTNTMSSSGILSGIGGDQITEMRIGIDPDPTSGFYGTNLLVFEGITAVPEPSSVLLLGSAAACFVLRRRRN